MQKRHDLSYYADKIMGFEAMIGENRQLVTDAPVEFEK